MFDFRLKVFHTVAKRLNFTKAAEELYITQPAVSKHIREMENHYKVRLFERNGTKTQLTKAGEILFGYTTRLFDIYSQLEFDLNTLNSHFSGLLRIGASTTIAQYVLPQLLADFHAKSDNIRITLTIGNTEDIERALVAGEIDFGIVEGQSKNPLFRYSDFINDEIVLTAGIHHPLVKKQEITTKELTNIPLLLREPGSGTLEVIGHALKPHGIKLSDLRCEMQLGSTESIKSYLTHSHCAAFLSIHSILKELKNNELSIIDVEKLNIERTFHFIRLHGETEGLPELFIQFADNYNFR